MRFESISLGELTKSLFIQKKNGMQRILLLKILKPRFFMARFWRNILMLQEE